MTENPRYQAMLVGMDRVADFLAHVHEAVDLALKIDGHCKSYEGAIDVSFPSFFEVRDADIVEREPQVTLQLHCYVLGPGRHKDWQGNNVGECLAKACRDIDRWLAEYTEDEEDPWESSIPETPFPDTQPPEE